MSTVSMLKKAAALVGLAAAAEGLGTVYFYRRTMLRSNAKPERSAKMSGIDWSRYFPLMKENQEWLLAQPHEEVDLRSQDGLRLHGYYFPGPGNKVAICFHGYTSSGMGEYPSLARFFISRGFGVLIVDQRAHGKSEGKYVGFGCKDRLDAMQWIRWTVDKVGEDAQILLHGGSMGGSTVCMVSGLDLPPQVKGIVSDSAFTSPKEVFTHVLHTMYHLPAFPIIPLSDQINKHLAGYGLDECNAAREVRKAKVPMLFIHGSKDSFVPSWMCDEIYENCAAPKTRMIVEGAGHVESYYKNTQDYQAALDKFMGGIIV